LFVIYFQGL